jgi:hypothetical protein
MFGGIYPTMCIYNDVTLVTVRMCLDILLISSIQLLACNYSTCTYLLSEGSSHRFKFCICVLWGPTGFPLNAALNLQSGIRHGDKSSSAQNSRGHPIGDLNIGTKRRLLCTVVVQLIAGQNLIASLGDVCMLLSVPRGAPKHG